MHRLSLFFLLVSYCFVTVAGVTSEDSVNVAPAITGQLPAAVDEDQTFSLTSEYLLVSDPDNVYPTDFSINVLAGANYSVTGNLITPLTNFTGTLSVPVTVSDGQATSNEFQFQLGIVAVNDAPLIEGQTAVNTEEGEPLTIPMSGLIVNDPDNTYPTGFSLTVLPGSNYTLSGTTVTPVEGFNGSLAVPVYVNDGAANSNTYTMDVAVTAVNDPPVITAQVPLETPEEVPLTISLNHLTVSDPDNSYPTGFTLNVMAGANYTVSGSTVTPAANFNGTLSIPVSVNDGTSSSELFNLQVNVTAVNDKPVITGQTEVRTNEDTPVAITLSQLQISDPDNDINSLTLSVGAGQNYTVSGNTVTPSPDFTGTLSVPVTVYDGQVSSDPFMLQVIVSDVDDAPTITGQNPIATNEDTGVTLQLSNFVVSDPGNPSLQGLTLVVLAGSNYTVSGTTVTPSANFSGTLTVPVRVNDGTNNSDVFNATVTVNAINDPPVITGQTAMSIYRNTTAVIELLNLTVSDIDDQYPDGFTISLQPGDNYSVTGQTVIPAANFVGVISVPVTVSDGEASSNPFSFKINVLAPPNVAPVITSQANLSTYENQPVLLQLAHFQVDDPDSNYPTGFSLSVQAGTNYTVNGTTVIPASNFSGTLTVPVRVFDGQAYSPWYQTSITVLPVSEAPLITGQSFLRINEDDSLTIVFSHLLVSDPDNTYPQGFTMTLLDAENYSLNGNQVKPDADYNGYLSVPVTVSDGENTSPVYQLLILVDAVNDPPVITATVTEKLFIRADEGQPLFSDVTITDVDSDTLAFAEIRISRNFESGKDTLMFEGFETIRGVFDRTEGTLLFFGRASVEDYQAAVREVRYNYLSSDMGEGKVIEVTANDGQVGSVPLELSILFGDNNFVLDIPTGFTPNGDGINDTWEIVSADNGLNVDKAVLRIYDKRGFLVYEATGIRPGWNGKLNGSDLPSDSYFFTLDLNIRNIRNHYKGMVTILR